MIRVEDLRKHFGEVPAVDGISFEAPDGQVTGLLGPNGAGKTTTLRMLYGLMSPDAGHIEVDGSQVADDPQAAQAKMGILPDSRGLYPRLTPREHLRYFGQLHQLDGPTLDARIDELVQLLDMGSIVDRRAEGFSQGERVKTALGRALVHDPANVILDEPTNGLDVMGTRAMRSLIRRMREEGKCVLFSSHIMQEVSALCDRIIIISTGRIVAAGTPDELREQSGQANLEDAFVVLTGLDEVAP
ncbi:MAG: ATP-binding cassette domain-containing protein [Gemmatimonadetes bacterium]|jgi:sodium transport system ATP-binding protein|nr:ATP-binding cassette domain-containing protein [Gemmatimonadota bacterium]MDE0963658.1 ATP-binding cassette domain-containing protein [Candidatus Latescibacterota bacterium]MBT5327019.1 ATP-binding cassette domain-containing protein [Gemmatimonadota bacterium]MBT5452862.1 ATP-binding cassette domain-containing protein [Gemmatimonadota bacterium]MBT5801079.1 ATP-binding cassette domain-containing protein [Gemmatimonadota bacterium]|tara:strand:- start:818 stop:1549 length:732 start_codon:yes stop_codon:yes gene_type:complete